MVISVLAMCELVLVGNGVDVQPTGRAITIARVCARTSNNDQTLELVVRWGVEEGLELGRGGVLPMYRLQDRAKAGMGLRLGRCREMYVSGPRCRLGTWKVH